MEQAQMTKTALATELGIARSTLYYKPKKPPENEEFKQKIISVMQQHPAYGSRRVAIALGMNRKKAKRLMQEYSLRPKRARGFRLVKPDDIGKPETAVVNILKVICPIRGNVIWAGDFTYLWFQDRFWYVATVIDVCTREIVGWHIANYHTTALIVAAFADAVRRTGTTPKWFHSDQGSEYVCGAYLSLLDQHGVIPSHSRKSSPWQNGFQESFYNNFKLELGTIRRFDHVGQLIEAIHTQMRYYNNERIHTALRMSPVAFRIRHSEKETSTSTYYSLLSTPLIGNCV